MDTMPGFLRSLYRRHKKELIALLCTPVPLAGGIWSFDLSKLTSAGAMEPELQLRIRCILSLGLALVLWAMSIIRLLFWYKNDVARLSNQPKRGIIHPGVDAD